MNPRIGSLLQNTDHFTAEKAIEGVKNLKDGTRKKGGSFLSHPLQKGWSGRSERER